MFFHIRELEVRPKLFDTTIAPGAIDYQDAKLRQQSPLRAVGEAKLVMGALGEIRVSGHITVTMEADCDRCLEPAPVPIDEEFSLFYRPVTDGFGDEKEIDSGEAEMGFYEDDGVELNDVVREFVLLSMPMQRVCREDCKGICPKCGQNRNLKECGCAQAQNDHRWAALKSLK